MDKKSKDNEYDGVVYEPSDYIEPTRIRRTPTAPKQSRPPAGRPAGRSAGASSRQTGRPSARKPAPKSQFTIFYILTLVAAVTLCIVIFLVVFNSASKRPSTVPETPTAGTQPVVPTEAAVAIEGTTDILGFIQEIVPSSHQVRILDIDGGTVVTLEADAKTILTSRYGQTMLFSEFRPGDVVEAMFTTKTSVLKSMGLSGDSWEYKQIKDVKIDVVNQTLTHGNDTYKFGRGFMVRYKNQPYDVADIKMMDVCTIRGYKDTVWAIEILRSHGTLVIIGKEGIIDGLLEINTDVFTMLDAFETMDVVEGEHRLVIKGTNVEPFVKLVQINPGEVTTVDLAEAQLKSGVLRLTVNESFYTLTIDGEIRSTSEPIVLKYGTYALKIEKDDFEPWEGMVEISSPTVDVNVELKEIFKLARLKVTTTPAGAEIYVDNSLVGLSPIEVPVEMGVHTVMPRLEGYISVSMPVSVTVDRPVYDMLFELQPRTEEVLP